MLLSEAARIQLFEDIDAIPALEGVGVGYMDGMSCRVLRLAAHGSGFGTWVILEETEFVARSNGTPPPPSPSKNAKSSRIRKELISAGINCTGAVLAGAAASAGVAATPVTGGASAIVTLVAGAAALASAAQCGLGIGRVVMEIADPGWTEELDNEDWYGAASNVLDAVNLAGIVVGAPGAYQSLAKILQMKKVTGKSVAALLKGLTRQERKAVAKELAKAAEQLSNKQWKQLVRAGKLPKIYSQKAINATVVETLLSRVSDVLSLYGSQDSGNIALLVHVVQE